jgi:hypothetical protein
LNYQQLILQAFFLICQIFEIVFFARFKMAAGKHQEPLSSRSSRCKYQVFLGFGGKDTRKNFTDRSSQPLFKQGSTHLETMMKLGEEKTSSQFRQTIQQ